MNPMMATPVLIPPPSEGNGRVSAAWLLSLSLAMMAPVLNFETTTMPRNAFAALEREERPRTRELPEV
jgi:hypothetical protein